MRQPGEDIELAAVRNIPGALGIARGIHPSSWGAFLFWYLPAAERVHVDENLMLRRIRIPAWDLSSPADEAKTCDPS
jgi:hypothetical protein